MDDLERGERIKGARTALHLTQPAVVELFEQRAREAGWTPEKPGDHPLSLRGYQEWERGGGIKWDNAKLLGAVLDIDPDFILTGRERVEGGPTPDLSLRAVRDEFRPDVDTVQQQLERIEQALAAASSERERIEQAVTAQNENLAEQTRILNEIRGLVDVLSDVRSIERVSASAAEAAVRQIAEQGLPGELGRRAQSAERAQQSRGRTGPGSPGQQRKPA